MSSGYPAPAWHHIDEFCAADQWTAVRSTDHVVWEKVLRTGEVLRTQRSFARQKTIGENLFRKILRDQLKVGVADFWRAIQSGEPVDRPVPTVEAPPEYPAWVLFGLAKYGYDHERVRREMTPQEAQALLEQKRSEPPE